MHSNVRTQSLLYSLPVPMINYLEMFFERKKPSIEPTFDIHKQSSHFYLAKARTEELSIFLRAKTHIGGT